MHLNKKNVYEIKKQSGVSEIKMINKGYSLNKGGVFMTMLCRFRMTVHVFVKVVLIPKKRDWHVLRMWKGEGK